MSLVVFAQGQGVRSGRSLLVTKAEAFSQAD